ncbi:DnaJ subfamily C member 21 [Sphaceloma murrayae]|uniref:DnaJ subfamily C member 21 n=1 Tax=Sphaceloma murrayae TaxID=2082308 RepID=A0A2K1QQ79_9PEZI|nr:DnaJ subfamily C member 21 [Sphaceloma murrayae]
MGASQSSTTPNETATTVKTSYYTLLGIDRSATEDEIKKAYRRKALELHPDRNYGNVEAATALFAEIQTAHEILSDPQERAWYDSHESAILRGDDDVGGGQGGEVFEGNVKVTTADDLARMVRKFNSGVEFTDAPSGFFGFLRETFEHLAKEEDVAVQWDGGDAVEYPSFGHKDDDYEDVVKPFYAVWAGFATKKSFKWKDKFRLSEAPDRRYRRAMEKENQKAREEGIREFNDAVRSLVAFVRKRDPRYVPTQQSEEERQKVLRDAANAQKARARRENEEKLKEAVPEWAQVTQKDELEGEIEDSESEEEHFECVACRKTFKSEKQWEAHERSKKHQKAVQGLKAKMRKENKHLHLDDEDDTSPGISTPVSDDADRVISDESDIDQVTDKDLAQQIDTIDLEKQPLNEPEALQAEHPEEQQEAPESESDDSADSDYAPSDKVKDRLARETDLHDSQDAQSDDQGQKAESQQQQQQQPKMGKAAQKRAKKAAAAAANAEEQESKFQCAVCKASFPSKTRLFQHIKDFNHAALKTVGSGGPAKGKKGKR